MTRIRSFSDREQAWKSPAGASAARAPAEAVVRKRLRLQRQPEQPFEPIFVSIDPPSSFVGGRPGAFAADANDANAGSKPMSRTGARRKQLSPAVTALLFLSFFEDGLGIVSW